MSFSALLDRQTRREGIHMVPVMSFRGVPRSLRHRNGLRARSVWSTCAPSRGLALRTDLRWLPGAFSIVKLDSDTRRQNGETGCQGKWGAVEYEHSERKESHFTDSQRREQCCPLSTTDGEVFDRSCSLRRRRKQKAIPEPCRRRTLRLSPLSRL